MGKFPYQPNPDVFVQVSICSVNTFLDFHPFNINLNAANRHKIDSVLLNSVGSNFILFHEYTYTEELRELYQNYSNQNNCIIIGGSGLESNGANFYAYAPVFTPNQELIKVYKRRITHVETILSESRIIDYPNKVPRQIKVAINNDIDVLVSVYVCYDFLVEGKTEVRDDIIFVPQFEPSPQQFITEGDKISKGWDNFVLGANNSNDNQRSIGFVPTLNSQSINSLALRHWRDKRYPSGKGKLDSHHHTISFDITGEKLITFQLNVGNPVTKGSTLSFVSSQPNFKPIAEFAL